MHVYRDSDGFLHSDAHPWVTPFLEVRELNGERVALFLANADAEHRQQNGFRTHTMKWALNIVERADRDMMRNTRYPQDYRTQQHAEYERAIDALKNPNAAAPKQRRYYYQPGLQPASRHAHP